MTERDAARRLLVAELRSLDERIEVLGREFDEIVAGSESVNTDDEHDPEGATIAFERARAASLRDDAAARRASVLAALVRLDTGTYGVCIACDRPIEPERLEVLPEADRCASCAGVRPGDRG